MMLRTTVSRVKKTWSGGFIPRLLKGKPVTNAVLRKSFKSSKATDDGKQGKDQALEKDSVEKKSEEPASLENKSAEVPPSIPLTYRERCQRMIDKAFGSCEHAEHDLEPSQTYFSHKINLEATRREIFESEKAKLKLQEQVKIQNPLLPESRTQYGISKMTAELNKDDDNQDEIVLSKESVLKVPPTVNGPTFADTEDLVKTLNITAAEEPNETKNSDNVGIAEDSALLESYSSNAKEDVEKCMNNPECVENNTLSGNDAEAIEMVKDDVYQKAIPKEEIHTLIPYTKLSFNQFGFLYPVMHGDENQDEIILMDKTIKLPPVIFSQLAGMENLLTNAEEDKCVQNLQSVENKAVHDDDSETVEMDQDVRKHMFINATTGKEEEEKLIQKLETIDETPLVEAQIPKIEGFNVNPKVLGDHKNKPVLKSKSIENDKGYIPRIPLLPGYDLDDVVARRCLNSPLRQIDEILLNEIEKRHIIKIKLPDLNEEAEVKKAQAPMSEKYDYSFRSKILKPEYTHHHVTHFKGIENSSYSETVNASNNAMDELQSKEADEISLYSRNIWTRYLPVQGQENAVSKNKHLQHEGKGETIIIERSETPQGQTIKEAVMGHPEMTYYRGLLEGMPHTNFSLPAHKWEETMEDSEAKSYLKEDLQLKPDQEYAKISVAEELFKDHELDPFYVLACNETCPIAPIMTRSTYNHNDFVDTSETIYMKKNICESLRPRPLPRDVNMTSEQKLTETQEQHEQDEEFEPEIIPESCIPTDTPEDNSTDTPDTLASLKDIEQMSLTELLRRVRQRSRLQGVSYLKALDVKVEPNVWKYCGTAPRCYPTAPRSPPNELVPPPSLGLPMLKRWPPICKTPNKECKCTACNMDVSCGGQIGEISQGLPLAYELNEADSVAVTCKVDLNEVILDRVRSLGNVISGVLHQVKSTTEIFFARDYDPWAPIPSWPSPQEPEKKWQPGKRCDYGCPIYPEARASMKRDPPCGVKPCQGFPKRTFSMLDYLAVPVDDVEVNSVGDF